MWAFYANRAQGITSFGTANKDTAIMEFNSANKVDLKIFRCLSFKNSHHLALGDKTNEKCVELISMFFFWLIFMCPFPILSPSSPHLLLVL
jgi:hypothetical protein